MFALAGLQPLPASVKDARAALPAKRDLGASAAAPPHATLARDGRARGRRADAALAFDGVWHELGRGPCCCQISISSSRRARRSR
jgi:hypothetical protein